MSKNKLIAMKRITKDISEIKKNPIKGIGIVQYEDDFMKYIVNIKILTGIYEGYCLQLLLSFSEYYPTKPPKIQIFPNQTFCQTYHHHIFDDSQGFKKFCFDLLENDFMNINEANTGWNPSYTISSLLLQVQNFLSDPDMPKNRLPNKSQVDFLLESMNNYVRTFVDENKNEIIHTWDYPYPPMFGVETKAKQNENDEIEKALKEIEEKEKNEKLETSKYNEENKEKEKENKSGYFSSTRSYLSSILSYFLRTGKIYDIEEDEKEEEKEDEKEEENENDEEEDKEENYLENDENENTKENKVNDKDKENSTNNSKINENNELKENKINDDEEKNKEEIKEKKDEQKDEKIIEEIKQNLSCFLLRVNIIDDKDIALGYPLKQLKALGDKIECVPIPEILSYEGYISQIAKQDGKLDDYFNVTFKAANNEYYNYWLPIYINEEHFKRNKILILNSFSVLKFGAKGQKEYDFKPEHIFEYLPNLLNKMICGMFNNKSYMSEAYLRCYFQYLLLFKKLIGEFKEDFSVYLNNIIDSIKNNKYHINKKNVPDLGNLFMLLYFSDIDLDKKIWNILFEEKMIRKMYWTFHFSENTSKCKNLFKEYGGNKEVNKKILDILKSENIFYYEYLEGIDNDKEYKPCREECLFSLASLEITKSEGMKSQKGLFSECIEKGIFEKIIDFISKDINKKPKNLNELFSKGKNTKINNELKDKVKIRIMKEFPYIYRHECSSDSQKKIDRLILKNIDLLKYCSNELKEKKQLKTDSLIETNQVDKLMKQIDKKYHLEITKKLYDISKSNLLLITTLAQMKINEPGFLKELENNYGVFIKVEEFMQEINKKLKEIQCYKDLFNFMKADVINKDDDEYELIIKSYEKAKKKRYIQPTISEIIRGLNFRIGKDFDKNDPKNKISIHFNKIINKRKYDDKTNNNKNGRINNNFKNKNNKKIKRNYNNINNKQKKNNGTKKKNNFNSHFVDLDEFLGD